MKYYFYEKHVSFEIFNKELINLKLEQKEYDYIIKTAKSAAFHKFVDLILHHLPTESHKSDFINLLKTKNSDNITDYLSNFIDNYENIIKKHAIEIEKDLIKLLK